MDAVHPSLTPMRSEGRPSSLRYGPPVDAQPPPAQFETVSKFRQKYPVRWARFSKDSAVGENVQVGRSCPAGSRRSSDEGPWSLEPAEASDRQVWRESRLRFGAAGLGVVRQALGGAEVRDASFEAVRCLRVGELRQAGGFQTFGM